MSSNTERLHLLITNFQRKWGTKALAHGPAALPRPYDPLRTGHAALDDLLGGGLPRSAITEVLGQPTSGATSLILQTMAHAQQQGEVVTFVDLRHTFDPLIAQDIGVHLQDLLLVRPRNLTQGLSIVEDLVQGAGSGLIVINSTQALVTAQRGTALAEKALRRWLVPLAQSSTAIVFLTFAAETPPALRAVRHHALLRLRLQGQRWLRTQGEITGFDTTATILKGQRHVGRTVPLRILL